MVDRIPGVEWLGRRPKDDVLRLMQEASFLVVPSLWYEGFPMAVNYGLDKVRFPSPVRVGARVRAGAELAEVVDVGTGVQVKTLITIEVEGGEKPACVIESLARWFA